MPTRSPHQSYPASLGFVPYIPHQPSSFQVFSTVGGPSAASTSILKASWTPNSGASIYVTPQEQNIHQGQAFEGAEHVFVGNGQGLSISSHGSTWFNHLLILITHLPIRTCCMFLP